MRLLQRITGALFAVGALNFAAAARALSATFERPVVLREPADVALPAFVAGESPMVYMWFTSA